MVAPAPFSYSISGIIIQPREGNHILLFSTEEGWSLPQITWETAIYAHWTDVADASSFMMTVPVALSIEDILRLGALTPLVHAMCRQLAGGPVPVTLEHGDFHDGNIAIIGRHPLYFDWTDSCIAHPFFSLYPFLLGVETKWPDVVAIRQRLRDTYLEPWERYTAKEQLIEIFELAQKLAPLYLATLYSSLIIPKMEAKWEMQYAVPYNLQVLLERIGDATGSV